MKTNFDELQTLGKDNLETVVASATAISKGYQTIATEVADYAKKAFEDGTAAFEKTISAKSVEGALDVQSRFAKEAYETYVDRMTKLGEIYVEAAKDAYKPFEARVGEFAGKTGNVTKAA